jgi:hypothetical protein
MIDEVTQAALQSFDKAHTIEQKNTVVDSDKFYLCMTNNCVMFVVRLNIKTYFTTRLDIDLPLISKPGSSSLQSRRTFIHRDPGHLAKPPFSFKLRK